MPRDIAELLLFRSVSSVRGGGHRCAACRRTPLAGEHMHTLADERIVCSLCLAKLPESKRETLRSERVHAAENRLAVVSRAAAA